MGGVDVTSSRDRDDGRDELCRLLRCLVESDVLGDEARGWLKECDIDLRELHRCLCEDGDTGGRQINEEAIRGVASIRDQLTRLVKRSGRFD
jgi:hypothetical protein